MKLILCYFILLIFSSAVGFAQNRSKVGVNVVDDDPTPIYYKWLGDESKTLTRMKLIYKKPDGFREVSKTECFKEYPQLEQAFGCFGNQLISENNEFIAFMPIFEPLTEEDSLRFQRLFPSKSFDFVDKQHLRQIRATIKAYQGEEVAEKMTDLLTYYPEEVTKSKFNADTVFRYSMKLKRKDYYKEKFKYVDFLCLQKKGRGYILFYCFYTAKAKRNLNDYWKKIEGVLRYEN